LFILLCIVFGYIILFEIQSFLDAKYNSISCINVFATLPFRVFLQLHFCHTNVPLFLFDQQFNNDSYTCNAKVS